MAYVNEVQGNPDGLAGGFILVNRYQPTAASSTTAEYTFPNVQSYNPFTRYTSATINGAGFVYDTNRMLSGGTITSAVFEYGYTKIPVDTTVYTLATEAYSQFSLPVATFLQMYENGQSYLLPNIILSGNDTYAAAGSSIKSYGGDDVINLYPDLGIGLTGSFVDGSAGTDIVVFPTSLLSQVTQIKSGGGNETVFLPTYSASLVSVPTLRFIDGSVFETNADAGAQAILMFKGIFGRVPDAINAGGYAQLAEGSGTFAAGASMLSTQEGQADTAGLSDQAYITRLYQNILGRAPEPSAVAGLQANLASGGSTRASIAAQMAASAEAQQVNAPLFTNRQVFAANPNAVDVLRAYEVLLNRTPEAQSLITDVAGLTSGGSVYDLYRSIQLSQEFASDGPNRFGITAATPVASIYAIAHSDTVTAMLQPLITTNGVAVHS